MIPQLYPGHQGDDDHERCLDSTLDGRHAEVLAKRRRNVDASRLACWLDERATRRLTGRPGDTIAPGEKGAYRG